jgi:uncharacterized protein (UPF0261 family)
VQDESAVLIIATMDTKGREVEFLCRCFKELGIPVCTVDGGIMGDSPVPVTVSREEVARRGGADLSQVRKIRHQGEALSIMMDGAIRCAQGLSREGRIRGIIGLGGSMGTILATGVMRALPIGFPKIMVSTVASRNTRSYVGTKDIFMLNSICDLSGINRITEQVLRNCAHAMAGMVQNRIDIPASSKPLIAMSTLGTIDACAQRVRQSLENRGKEVVLFSTNGSGGEAMEEMLWEQGAEGVIDLSLHELMNQRFGGDHDAGPLRGSVAIQMGIPSVLVTGNMDFLAAGPMSAAEKQFPGRTLHAYSETVTFVRTKKRELEAVAVSLAQVCNEAKGPLSLVVPMGGFSSLDRKGGPFYDPEAIRVFVKVLRYELEPAIPFYTLPYHINDPESAETIMEVFEGLASPQ